MIFFSCFHGFPHYSQFLIILFVVGFFVRCKTCSLADPSGGCGEGRCEKDRTWDGIQWGQGMVTSWRNARDSCRPGFAGCELCTKRWEPIGASAQTSMMSFSLKTDIHCSLYQSSISSRNHILICKLNMINKTSSTYHLSTIYLVVIYLYLPMWLFLNI